MTGHRITRFYSDGRVERRRGRVLTLEEARAHCSRADTRGVTRDGVRWFDGFREVRA